MPETGADSTLASVPVVGATPSVRDGRPVRRQISGMVVRVHLGLGLAIAGLVSAGLLVAELVQGWATWCAPIFAVAAVALSAVAAWIGLWGVIRYSIFTEGRGAANMAHELRLGRIGFWAGTLAQFTIVVTLVAVIVAVARALL